MTRRAVLKEHIHEAWRRTIDSEYNSRLVNREAALQAYLVKHLGNVFQEADVSRQIFVEPPLRLGNSNDGFRTYIPDVVVCSERKIIGVIELKYAPRGMPQYAMDLEKLKTIFESRDPGIKICAERYQGPEPGHQFGFSSDVLLVYAAVHDGGASEWQENLQRHVDGVQDEKTRRAFFLVGAKTHPRQPAAVWPELPLRAR